MKKFKKVKVDKDELTMISCNKCGKAYKNEKKDHNLDLFHEFSTSFGYHSNFDMEQWSFDLCEDCLVDLVKTFKYVPSGFKLDNSFSLIEDQSKEHQLLFDHWKKTGEWDEFMVTSYEDMVKFAGFINTDFLNKKIKKYHPNRLLIGE
ncbi:hypothetical protein [Paraliobacillus ryukyuensis]|uniref:hypothetical protein n=1 Tax=Paraliobacillus ryukyuensis TaxID=200904 RepID=UPI00117F551E|nr:hypothetical protein [Paraliobacillus ryukyuensis]